MFCVFFKSVSPSIKPYSMRQYCSGGFKGVGVAAGAAAPYWLIFFLKSRFPCKRHTFRCAHLR